MTYFIVIKMIDENVENFELKVNAGNPEEAKEKATIYLENREHRIDSIKSVTRLIEILD